MPTYDIFDEYRYFEPADSWQTLTYKGKKIALTICEDIWNVGNENPLYRICPMDEMMDQKPDLMINISASPFSYDHAPDRIHVIKANVERYKLPVFYACSDVFTCTLFYIKSSSCRGLTLFICMSRTRRKRNA